MSRIKRKKIMIILSARRHRGIAHRLHYNAESPEGEEDFLTQKRK
jgi:hypothetical protein